MQWAGVGMGVLLLFAAFLPLLLDRIRRGRPARIKIEDGMIMIEPRGIFRLLASGTWLRTPAKTLAEAIPVHRQELGPAGLSTAERRLPLWCALAFPGLLAGTFHGPAGHSLWLCGQRARAVRLHFVDAPVDFAVVQVNDPDETARILSAFAGGGWI
ncbi:hypothetical protein GCM10010468_58570 [Actinocorallia longicatena]|uniref:Bacterial Pleckstrin homology domain-containing protein n=1 Tax=Actinocorallia longicatena TaxID=111803 RepID=A0ABP6QH73_9ACTN